MAGVLSFQGAVSEHLAALDAAFASTGISGFGRKVRYADEIASCDCLCIPGGESTTISKLSVENGAFDAIKRKAAEGMPILGTCAGLIMLSKRGDAQVKKTGQKLLGLLDVSINRNAFGRQIDSFETDLEVSFLSPKSFHAVFIRAPKIERVNDSSIEVISRLPDGTVVGVRRKNVIGLSFHPELSGDFRVHEYLIGLARRPQH